MRCIEIATHEGNIHVLEAEAESHATTSLFYKQCTECTLRFVNPDSTQDLSGIDLHAATIKLVLDPHLVLLLYSLKTEDSIQN